ncbi:MAG: recombinase family protein [Aminipila sp.]
MKKIAIYIRVSTEEQKLEGYSLDAQKRTLIGWCKRNGHEVYHIYADEGKSGKDIKHREQMQTMLEDAKQGLFDIILVWKLTRFTRNLSNLCTTCDMLEKHKVAFVSYTEGFDCTTPAGRLMRNMLGVIAQFEREVISENVAMALHERAQQGKVTCSYILGYDNKNGSLVINECESEIVRFIYSEYLACANASKVARLCNEHGCTGKKGKPFTAQTIFNVLTSFTYCGYYSWKGAPLPATHEPIVSKADYNKVQDILASKGKNVVRI